MLVVVSQYAMACFLWSLWHAMSFQKLRSILDMGYDAASRSMVAISGHGDVSPHSLNAPLTTQMVVMYFPTTSPNRSVECMHNFRVGPDVMKATSSSPGLEISILGFRSKRGTYGAGSFHTPQPPRRALFSHG